MAKVKTNPIVELIRGKVGDLVFKRFGDEVILSRIPDMEDREPTQAQLDAQKDFKQAALYGKTVIEADDDAKELYEQASKAKRKPLFSLMVADFYHAPSIDEIDLSEYGGQPDDPIAVRAHDDFQVTGVSISIADAGGQTIESGAAGETKAGSGLWVYRATQTVAPGTTVRIGVTATDRPKHIGEAEQEKTL
jgi:hypothetical protein